jgi:hypothetical protein
MRERVTSAADTFRQPLAFWPHQRGEKSPLSVLSAWALSGAMAPAAEMLAGGAVLALGSLLNGERLQHWPTQEGWLALLYLVCLLTGCRLLGVRHLTQYND